MGTLARVSTREAAVLRFVACKFWLRFAKRPSARTARKVFLISPFLLFSGVEITDSEFTARKRTPFIPIDCYELRHVI